MGPFEFDAELWLWDGDAAWHFVTVPEDVSDEIEASATAGGFGSVPVSVTVGSTTWSTSIFPDTKRGAYLLPVKKDVRRREGLEAGTRVALALQVREGTSG
ncbi:MAG TPA: DUF1905 domain-containing protein [Egibacteraceae bacterium]|nr:DUF1905 domain-containing protein [Egibacteraceae bacterium]